MLDWQGTTRTISGLRRGKNVRAIPKNRTAALQAGQITNNSPWTIEVRAVRVVNSESVCYSVGVLRRTAVAGYARRSKRPMKDQPWCKVKRQIKMIGNQSPNSHSPNIKISEPTGKNQPPYNEAINSCPAWTNQVITVRAVWIRMVLSKITSNGTLEPGEFSAV